MFTLNSYWPRLVFNSRFLSIFWIYFKIFYNIDRPFDLLPIYCSKNYRKTEIWLLIQKDIIWYLQFLVFELTIDKSDIWNLLTSCMVLNSQSVIFKFLDSLQNTSKYNISGPNLKYLQKLLPRTKKPRLVLDI